MIREIERTKKALRKANQRFEVLFDRAPVMMDFIDGDGRLVKVNRRWLQTMGYERDEVLGRKCGEFLTEDSRALAFKETLPLFWRAGSIRNVGYQFVTKDGRVLDVLLDGEVDIGTAGKPFGLAAIREGHDPIQRQQASATISAIKQHACVQHALEAVLSANGSKRPEADVLEVKHSPRYALENGSQGELPGAFFEPIQYIAAYLRDLLRVQEELRDVTMEHKRELSSVAKSIAKTLAGLAERTAMDPFQMHRGRMPAAALLKGLGRVLDAWDPQTRGHSERVGEYAFRLGRKLGLSNRQCECLRYGAFLHDLGKIGVGDSILSKPGPLSEEESKRVRSHPLIGTRILEGFGVEAVGEEAVRNHHERWDGKGYPDGLKGEDIPIAARVLTVVDTYDALVAGRPYREAVAPVEAEAILKQGKGSQYDPMVVDAFLEMMGSPMAAPADTAATAPRVSQ